jgi:hypothetical protein
MANFRGNPPEQNLWYSLWDAWENLFVAYVTWLLSSVNTAKMPKVPYSFQENVSNIQFHKNQKKYVAKNDL